MTFSKTSFKNILFAALFAAFTLVASQSYAADANTQANEQAPRDGILIHISSGDDPHRLLMALSMANMMSAERDVLVYFDIDGIHTVLEKSPDTIFAHFNSARASIQNLLDKEITILACPGCMKVEGKTEEDLIKGVRLANKDDFFNFTKGRIVTLDY